MPKTRFGRFKIDRQSEHMHGWQAGAARLLYTTRDRDEVLFCIMYPAEALRQMPQFLHNDTPPCFGERLGRDQRNPDRSPNEELRRMALQRLYHLNDEFNRRIGWCAVVAAAVAAFVAAVETVLPNNWSLFQSLAE